MLVTDLYELTMAAGYLRRGMGRTATFRLFVRRLPPGRGFLVAAGVEDAVARLLELTVTREDVDWLLERRWPRDLAEPLLGLRFTGDAEAVPEGTVVLAGEPLLEVTGPLPGAQLVETAVLNAVTYQTALASTATRCVLAARGRPVVDFALRRTHGVEAGMAAARAGAIAGFAATSDVAAAERYGLAATGTMAHSFVQAFPDEQAAFGAFAEDFPAAPTFLVDTYDSARGVEAAIAVIRERDLGEAAAVRLDSGNLADEARRARGLLDAAGLPRVRIVVSGGLDAEGIEALVQGGAPAPRPGACPTGPACSPVATSRGRRTAGRCSSPRCAAATRWSRPGGSARRDNAALPVSRPCRQRRGGSRHRWRPCASSASGCVLNTTGRSPG